MQKLLSIAIAGLFIVGCGRSIDKKTPVDNNSTSANNVNNVVANNSNNNVVANNSNNSNNSTTTNNTAACIDAAPSSLNFGEVTLGESTTSSITIENCSADTPLKLLGISIPQGYQGGLPDLEQLAPFQSVTIQLVFQPTQATDYIGDISVQSDAGEVAISVQGQGITDEPVCPNAVARARAAGDDTWRDALTVTALTTVELTGQDSTHGGGEVIERYEWTVTQRPQGSTAQLAPSGQVMNPSFFIDLAGIYELTLNVFTATSPSGCPADSVTINATNGDEGISIQLVWDTPLDTDQTDDVGSDLDLHYLHPNPAGTWDTEPWDCYWLNRTPDWGVDGSPTVDIDDTNGAGPENITHTEPGGRVYDVGVYYFDDKGFGPSYATVRIYLDGQLELELKDRYLAAKDWFWHVAQIDWEARNVVAIDAVSDEGFPTN